MTTRNVSEFKYNLDLHLFVNYKHAYVCPEIITNYPAALRYRFIRTFRGVKYGYPIVYGAGLARHLLYPIKKLYRYWLGRKIIRVDEYKENIGYQNDYYCWIIPSEYVHKLLYVDEGHYKIPAETSDYLTFRYGDWHIVRKDWDFVRDDHSLVHSNIDELTEIVDVYRHMYDSELRLE